MPIASVSIARGPVLGRFPIRGCDRRLRPASMFVVFPCRRVLLRDMIYCCCESGSRYQTRRAASSFSGARVLVSSCSCSCERNRAFAVFRIFLFPFDRSLFGLTLLLLLLLFLGACRHGRLGRGGRTTGQRGGRRGLILLLVVVVLLLVVVMLALLARPQLGLLGGLVRVWETVDIFFLRERAVTKK